MAIETPLSQYLYNGEKPGPETLKSIKWDILKIRWWPQKPLDKWETYKKVNFNLVSMENDLSLKDADRKKLEKCREKLDQVWKRTYPKAFRKLIGRSRQLSREGGLPVDWVEHSYEFLQSNRERTGELLDQYGDGICQAIDELVTEAHTYRMVGMNGRVRNILTGAANMLDYFKGIYRKFEVSPPGQLDKSRERIGDAWEVYHKPPPEVSPLLLNQLIL